MLTFALVALAAQFAGAAHAPDRISSLPGWTGDLPTPQYSGYLAASNTSNLHYWFVESEEDPDNAPTVLWLNGGPGCSSLDGFFYENGPFEIDTSDYSKLVEREYRWNKVANMIFLEAPVGVGFSYSDDKDYKCDDDRTARENRAAVEDFFVKFPELKKNKFFITGESYGGVYVPTFAEEIVKGQLDGTYTGAKLTGIAVGNGCTGTELGICGSGPQGTYYEWTYLLGTSFVTMDLKEAINAECNWAAAKKNEPDALSVQCVSLLNEASTQIGHVNMYNIYGDCVSDSGCTKKDEGSEDRPPMSKIPLRPDYVVREEATGESRRLGRITPHGPDACIDSAAASGYLNDPAVMEAIHVREPGYCWSVCGQQAGWSYKSTRPNLPRDTYPLLVQNIQVVIYNGDWDACVPFTDNEDWTENMGFPVRTAWHPWTYTSTSGAENQVAGYSVEYDISSGEVDDNSHSGSFEFITVRGGRHEVPETSPAQALQMLDNMFNNRRF